MKRAYILRGIPGSGKSTLAEQLVGKSGAIHSTDHYFHIKGVYSFNPALLPQHHESNFVAFCRSLKRGIPIVVCDNTNIRREHYARYVSAAEMAGYQVDIVAMPHPDPEIAATRNKHGVPLETIQRMIADWED